MPISYKLYRNHLDNEVEKYSARVEYLDTIYEEDIIDEMMSYNSAMTKADTIAVLENYQAAIKRKVLQGFRVMTRCGQYGVTIKGNFTNQGDGFDPSRHRVEPQINLSPQLREAITNQITVEKVLAPVRQPMPVQYLSLSNGHTPNTLIPGGMGKLIGERLRYEPADPEQGLFLLAANGSERRLPTDGMIMPGSLVFMIPADLAPGAYRLEVRVRFDAATFSTGRLKDVLTAA
jgi:hypothetical protein